MDDPWERQGRLSAPTARIAARRKPMRIRASDAGSIKPPHRHLPPRECNSLALHRSNMDLCGAVHPRAVVGSDHRAEVERQRACPASSPAMPA